MDASIIHLIMRRKELQVRAAFNAVGATVAANAQSFENIGIEETMTVRRLTRRSVIREASPGMFYFDEDAWQALRAMRIKMAMLLVVTLALVGLLVIYAASAIQ